MAGIDPMHEFKSDHAKVGDALFDLIEAINEGDTSKALDILEQLDRLVGWADKIKDVKRKKGALVR